MKIRVFNQLGEFTVKEVSDDTIYYFRQGNSGKFVGLPLGDRTHSWDYVNESPFVPLVQIDAPVVPPQVMKPFDVEMLQEEPDEGKEIDPEKLKSQDDDSNEVIYDAE